MDANDGARAAGSSLFTEVYVRARLFLSVAGVVALFAATFEMTSTSASAAQQADYDLGFCYSGTFVGSGSNDLENGTLSFGWCKTSTGKATTITVRYDKCCGTNVTATFGYEWVARDGSPTSGRHWDQTGSVIIQATQTWGARFKRDPAEAAPSSATKCLRGLMKANGTVYSTRVVCPS